MTRIALDTMWILATLLLLVVTWILRDVVLLFLVSLAVAAALRPVVERIAPSGRRRMAALAGAHLGVAAGLIGLVLAAVGPLLTDVRIFTTDLKQAQQEMRETWPTGTPIQRSVSRWLPTQALAFSTEAGSKGELLRLLSGMTFGVVELGITLAFVLFLSWYWSVDRVRFERLWLSLLPVERRAPARDGWREIENECGAYLRSEVVQCVSAGLILWFGFSMLQQPYPTLLALVCAVAWLIPWFGGLVAVAVVLVMSLPAALTGDAPGLWHVGAPAAVLTLGVLMILEFVVEPRVFDRQRYNSILVTLVVLGLAERAALTGMLLGPPLAAAIQLAAIHWARSRAAPTDDDQADPAKWTDRVRQLRREIDQRDPPRPELGSLVDRLEKLVAETEVAAPPSAGS